MNAFLQCLEEMDVAGIRKLWRARAPHLHQPANDHEAEATLHRARTECGVLTVRQRAYSHRWLEDRGYPSGLPDNLKPSAERIYPRVVEGVGIAVHIGSRVLRPAAPIIRGAMEEVVLDEYAGKVVLNRLKGRMKEAHDKAVKKLFGWATVPKGFD